MTRSFVLALALVLPPLTVACTGSSEAVDVPGGSTTSVSTPPDDSVADTTSDSGSSASGPDATGTDPTTTTAPTSPTPTTTTLAATTSSVTTAARTVTLLRRGDEGPQVELFQLKLVALGYLPTGADTGVFDAATNSAVLKFQGDYGLVVDGLVGPETERAISAAAESINPEG